MLKINPTPELLPARVVREASLLSTGLLSDAMQGLGVMDCRIKPIAAGRAFAGTALTVNLRSGSNQMLHLAIGLAGPGHVLVVSGKDTTRAALGDLMARAAVKQGVSGIVLEGLVRDVGDLKQLDVPIFALGAVPAAVEREGPGECNGPIACGGVTVNPGDLIVGDDDGVVVVPREKITEVLQGANDKQQVEISRQQEIEAGKIIPDWLEKRISKCG